MRTRVTVLVAGAVAVALVAAGVVWWLNRPDTELERAAGFVPADAQRLSWTDWHGIREELGADVSASSSTGDLEDFLDRGYEADLTSASALVESATTLHERFGFSPATAEWELLSQSTDGAVDLVGLPESTDFDDLASGLEELGYEPPAEDDGVWRGGTSLLATLGPELTPELQYLALDRDEHLLLASDSAGYLEQVVDGIGDAGPEDLEGVVEGSGEPLSAAILSGDRACQELAMSAADRADQAEAEELITAAGEVNPVTGYALSAQPDGGMRVVMTFETEDQARANADSRSALAQGPAPGQGGDFADRFSVGEVTADGTVLTMDLDPVEGEYVLSDLSTGPVLFATC